ncbi:MAG: DUF4249 family protein [Bacteroidota bacterium]
MKKIFYVLVAFIAFSCETEVDPGLDSSLNILVIDAWLTNNDPIQHINITRSQPFFDASAPTKVGGATVTVTDLTDPTVPAFVFTERADRYTWESTDGSTLGVIGHEYQLDVEVGGASFTSVTQLSDVPPVDSIRFRLEEENAFFDDLIFAEFFATDLEGINDTYWIKAWKNGRYLGKPGEINIAYDAAFSVDPDNDGVQFIQPIRDLISPFEESREEETLSPYSLPDTLRIVADTTLAAGDTIFINFPALLYSDGTPFGIIDGENIMIAEDNTKLPDDVFSIPLDDEQLVQISSDKIFLQGDSVYVEIHSISNEAYFFMNQVITETTRAGGFGALFATPLANVSTNIVPDDPETSVAGFFNVAAVSGAGNRLESEDQIRIIE